MAESAGKLPRFTVRSGDASDTPDAVCLMATLAGLTEIGVRCVTHELNCLWLCEPASRVSIIVERAQPQTAVVGAAGGAFVCSAKAEELERGTTSGLFLVDVASALRADETPPPQQPVAVLTYDQLAEANSHSGAIFWATHWDWDPSLDANDKAVVRRMLVDGIVAALRGNRLREFLIEVYETGDGAPLVAAEHGLKAMSGFALQSLLIGESLLEVFPATRLWRFTSDDAVTPDGEQKAAARLFNQEPPVYYFGREQVEALSVATSGRSGRDALAAVNERRAERGAEALSQKGYYSSISHARKYVKDVNKLLRRQCLLEPPLRDSPKKGDLLEYLLQHPEELRPYESPPNWPKRPK